MKVGSKRGAIYVLPQAIPSPAPEPAASPASAAPVPQAQPVPPKGAPSMEQTKDTINQAAMRDLDAGIYYRMMDISRLYDFLKTAFKLARQWLGSTQGLKHKLLVAGIILWGGWMVVSWGMSLHQRYFPPTETLADDLKKELNQTQAKLDHSETLLQAKTEDFNASQQALAQAQRQINNLQQQAQKDQAQADIYIPMNQIVNWANQGVTSAQIIDRIKISHSTYSLTADDISWLRQHAVGEDVIKAMQDTIPITNNPSVQNQSHPIKNILGWVQDKINGQ